MINAIGLTEFGGPKVLKRITIEKPTPKEHQVLIKVQGVSVNFADIQTRKGSFHGSGAVFPIVPGLDAMGVVEAVGCLVKGIKVGERVIAFPHTGTYAEYVVADGNLAFPIPDEIIGSVGNNGKVETAREAGANEVIVDKEEDFVEKVNKLTEGKGADVILDSLGGTYTNRGMGCLAPYGRMVVFGNATGSYSQIGTNLLHSSCRSVLGYSSVTTRKTRPEWFADTAEAVINLMVSGNIDMKVSRILSIDESAKAHELMESGTVAGKIILRV